MAAEVARKVVPARERAGQHGQADREVDCAAADEAAKLPAEKLGLAGEMPADGVADAPGLVGQAGGLVEIHH